MERRDYAQGTYILYRMPWGLIVGGAALCPDGKVRKLKRISICADTFFSISASVTAKGKTVSGYVTVSTMAGLSTATENDLAILKFFPVLTGKNYNVFEEMK